MGMRENPDNSRRKRPKKPCQKAFTLAGRKPVPCRKPLIEKLNRQEKILIKQ